MNQATTVDEQFEQFRRENEELRKMYLVVSKEIEKLKEEIEKKESMIQLLEACLKDEVLDQYQKQKKFDPKRFAGIKGMTRKLAYELILKRGRPVSAEEIETYYEKNRVKYNLPPIKRGTVMRRVRELAQSGDLTKPKKGLYYINKIDTKTIDDFGGPEKNE